MCGRFSRYVTAATISDAFSVDRVLASLPPTWNAAPTQRVSVLVRRDDAPHETALDAHAWGLVPHWQREARGGQINARAETVHEKPAFRDAFRRRRCAVVATGYYEWRKVGRRKLPHHIHPGDGEPFAMAGVWEAPKGDRPATVAVVTTGASECVRAIHHRMPAILTGDALAAWLDPRAGDEDALLGLLKPHQGRLVADEVGSRVNSPRNDGAELVEPTGGRTATLGEWGVGE